MNRYVRQRFTLNRVNEETSDEEHLEEHLFAFVATKWATIKPLRPRPMGRLLDESERKGRGTSNHHRGRRRLRRLKAKVSSGKGSTCARRSAFLLFSLPIHSAFFHIHIPPGRCTVEERKRKKNKPFRIPSPFRCIFVRLILLQTCVCAAWAHRESE